jgi:hypothetical protein
MPPLHKLVLPVGLVIAAFTFGFWTVLGYRHFGVWVPDGLLRATFALGAVLLLAGVLWCARWVSERDRP